MLEITTDRPNFYCRKTGLFQEVLGAVASIAEVIVRGLMNLPLVRHSQQKAAARGQRSRHLPQYNRGLPHMLERDNVNARSKCAIAERKGLQIGDCVEGAIVPAGIADGEIDSAITRFREQATMPAFARARVEHTHSRRKIARKGGQRVVDGGFEIENLPAQESGKTIRGGGEAHVFLRASIMIVEPARQAASAIVNGSAATTTAK